MKTLLHTLLAVLFTAAAAFAQSYPSPVEHDLTIDNYKFVSGESLPSLRLHYATIGTPQTDAGGKVTNAVMILHGTSGSGRQFLGERFAGVLFGPGQLLDASKYFLILPDDVGHGRSSKPSDGLHAHFPEYEYADMVELEHRVMQSLHVDRLRLLMGTSMGCMHAWMWLEQYPEAVQAAMPLACLPAEIAGRNRFWRKLSMDAIRQEPEWAGGEYKSQPPGYRFAMGLLVIAAGAPLPMQKLCPTGAKADACVDEFIKTRMAASDANDLWYALNSSRHYDPSKGLDKIRVPVTAINFSDDFINPPELGIFQDEAGKVPSAKVVLMPITPETRGHGSHTIPNLWKEYLAELLQRSENVAAH